MFPSGPGAMLRGPLADPAGTVYSVMAPLGVISPILPALNSVNQMLPFGPKAMPFGWLLGVGTLYTVIVFGAPGVIFPIWSEFWMVNQMSPSAPTAMFWGPLVGGVVVDGNVNSVTDPVAARAGRANTPVTTNDPINAAAVPSARTRP